MSWPSKQRHMPKQRGNEMNIQVQHDSSQASYTSGQWLVLWDGKVVKRFWGDNAKNEASEYANILAGGPSEAQLFADRNA